MNRFGVKEIARFEGSGRLRDRLDNEVPVRYSILLSQAWENIPTVGGGSRLSEKHPDLTGHVEFYRDGGFLDRTSDKLTLTLDDDRTMEIVPRGRIPGPGEPMSFTVGRGGEQLLAEFFPKPAP